MSVPLKLVERPAGDIVVLQLRGHLVVDEGDRVLREHVRALAAAGKTAILIDLGEVSYIDSGGIGTLVQMYTEVVKLGGDLKLLHPSWRSARVLEITHLTSVFQIFEDEQEALRSFKDRESVR